MTMNSEQASERIDALRAQIRRHNRLYYVEAAPEIGDREYDVLYAELVELERRFPDLATPDSPTRRVGGEPLKGFETRAHSVPMLSLDNTYNDDDLRKFHEYVVRGLQTDRVDYTVEPKVDGVSISIRYENGLLAQALTRGNGTEGDDVTANVRTIQSIPLRLNADAPPPVLEARGEVFMSRQGFADLNTKRRAAGETQFANARNATAGTLKLLDPRLVAARPLDCVFYAQGEIRGLDVAGQKQLLDAFRQFGLRTQTFCPVVHGLDGILGAVHDLETKRHSFPYDIDGAVIKVNDFAQRRTLGFTAKAPSWAKAFKYEAEQTETVLRDITVQVGRTGVLTPVAELDPVALAGSTISRATLHNEDDIRKKDIRIGDTVVIEKAGDVIPAVVRIVPEKRPADTRPFDLVGHIDGVCPSCGSMVVRDPQFVAWRCENLYCPAQSVRRVRHFASRDAMDIEALGGIVAEKLVASECIAEPLDLFALKVGDIADLNLGTDEEPRVFGEKNATKLVDAVERARGMPLSRWLHAIGIPNVGATIAFQIARVHTDIRHVADSDILRDIIALVQKQDDLKELRKHSEAEYRQAGAELDRLAQRLIGLGLAKPGAAKGSSAKRYVTTHIGPKTAQSVLDFFASDMGRTILDRLRELGIDPRGEGTAENESAAGNSPETNRLANLTFVLTGTLETMSRDEAAERIRQLGGTAAGAVSKNTDFLVAGTNTGATKTRKAAQLGVKVISEKEFLRMLEGNAPENDDSGNAGDDHTPRNEEPPPHRAGNGPEQLSLPF
jgi:DNA ligase (NAD+)